MHDGLRLPRLFREHGYQTDLADLTGLASCRMYRSAGEVWSGLAKNATEGLGAPVRIVPVTLLLLLGQVVPFAVALGFFLCFSFCWCFPSLGSCHQGLSAWSHPCHSGYCAMVLGAFILGVCVVSAWLVRGVAARRFLQDWRSAVLHPVGVLLLAGGAVVCAWETGARAAGELEEPGVCKGFGLNREQPLVRCACLVETGNGELLGCVFALLRMTDPGGARIKLLARRPSSAAPR